MRSWLIYTAARVGLFAAAFGIVYLFGARLWLALILGWVISGLASYVLLSKWRDQISAGIVERHEQRRGARLGDRLEGGAAREDHLQEAAEGPEDAGGPRAEETGAEGDSAPEAAQESADGGEPAGSEPEPAGAEPRAETKDG